MSNVSDFSLLLIVLPNPENTFLNKQNLPIEEMAIGKTLCSKN